MILITGATGFIGQALTSTIAAGKNVEIRAISRKIVDCKIPNVQYFCVPDFSESTDWTAALSQVETVISTIGRVHIMADTSADPMREFRKINVDGTLNLARQAQKSGVKRFIFLSSAKVNGEFTISGNSFDADAIPMPQGPYAISKFEAENGLLELARETGLEVVIVRPPLVYGRGVRANFRAMMKYLYMGLPLPLGMVNNKRSLISVENLIDLIIRCINHPLAANQIFMASDGEDLSTSELLTRLGTALAKPARLFGVPPRVLRFMLAILGRAEFSARLCDSFQVNIDKTKRILNWTPPQSVDLGLRKTAEGFLYEKNI